MTRRLCAVLALVALVPAARARAQSGPGLSIRPYFLVSAESFAAASTFDAVFASSRGTFVGGGGQVTFGRFFVDVGASRFKRTGERAFAFNGNVFRLGIPLTATITPVEFSGGYRMRLQSVSWLVPYGGGGFGRYRYQESSEFDAANEGVDQHANGYLIYGGAEFRLHRWVGVSLDARYRHIPGILGGAGLSQDFGEDDLGGVAARFRVIVGP